MSRLDGKVAVITGAAEGLGEACARLFVEHGAKVIIADIQDDLGRNLAASLGTSASYFHCDICSERDVSDVVDHAVSKHGRLDIMFNNAGIAYGAGVPLEDLDVEKFDKVMRVNVRGVLLGMKHAARVMIPEKRGCILCTASVCAVTAVGKSVPYVTSKHAVVGLVKQGAAELGKHGIRVNSVSPFAVATGMTLGVARDVCKDFDVVAQRLSDAVEKISVLQGVQLQANDIAQAALFLASDDAKYINGHNLVVDGGFTVHKALDLQL